MTDFNTTCTDPLSVLPLNTTLYAGYCGVVFGTQSNNSHRYRAIYECAPPCAAVNLFQPCIEFTGGSPGDVFRTQTTTCGDTPKYHFDGYRGVADWTNCLIKNGLDVYDPDEDIIDTWCVGPDFGHGLRYREGLSEGAKIGVGIGVGVGGFLLLLSTALALLFAIKYRRIRRALPAKQ